MKIARTDFGFMALTLLGLLACLFPGLVMGPASAAWRTLTGQIDLFEARALWSWIGLLATLVVCVLGRAIFLLSHRSRTTGIHTVFYFLTASLVFGVVLVVF